MSGLFAVAGEASGDALLARVLTHWSGAAFGIGGPESLAAGLRPIRSADGLAAHGLVEAAASLPAALDALRRGRRALRRADRALLVDFPEVNMRLLRAARAPVAYLAPPQAWAWRPRRARALRRAAWVGCLLPFAAEWYRAQGVAAEWVGHPLAEAPPPPLPLTPAVALLPGSRESAVRALLPIMLGALAREGVPGHVALAPGIDRAWVERAVRASDLPVTVHQGADAALARATVALAGAGTATLACALANRPYVGLARLHPLSAWVAQRLVDLPAVSLPNLVLGRVAFPERVLEACTAVEVGRALAGLLADEHGPALAELRERVTRPGFGARVAARVRACRAPAPRARAARS